MEESSGQLRAYECKWNPSARVRTPTAFLEAYPESTFDVVTPENFFTQGRL